MPSETGLVSQIRKLAAAHTRNSSLVRGIGDDCAILRPRPKHDLVFTTDLVLEGRHFTLETHTPADIGHKALARSLSDLAAMGARPLFCLVALALPSDLAKSGSNKLWISSFYRGLLHLASLHHVALAGGDLASFDHVIADVMCCGEVPSGKALLRSAARPGDALYVTGSLGGSAHGLYTGQGINFLRHLRPEPRIQAGLKLRRAGVKCCMDISDGLSLDLHRLCLESKISADLHRPLPMAPEATEGEALHGGEDYELLFTAPANLPIPKRVAGLAITRIGTARAGQPGVITLDGKPLRPAGFDHFD